MDLAIKINKKDGNSETEFFKDVEILRWKDAIENHCSLEELKDFDLYFIPTRSVWQCIKVSRILNKHLYNLTKEINFIRLNKRKEVSFEEFQKIFPYYSIYYTYS
jgi:hypothetical protein